MLTDEAAAAFVEGDAVSSGVGQSGVGQSGAVPSVAEAYAAGGLGDARAPHFAGCQRSGVEDEVGSPADYYSSAQVCSRRISASVPDEYGR